MLNIKGLYLDNFRIFSEASHIRLAPVTILTGPNNSGKTTVARSLTMMKDLDTSSLPYRLRFDSGQNPFGSFNLIRNNHNGSRKISLAYDIYNIILGEEVKINFQFEKDGEFDAIAKHITISIKDSILFDFKFEKERIVVQTGLRYMLGKLHDIKRSKNKYLELEKSFKNIRSESGSYKNEVTEKKLEKEESSIRIFHVDNDLKRKNVLEYLKNQELTVEQYERLFYLFGKQKSMPVKGSPEEEYVSRIRRILADFDEKEILLNNKLVRRIAAIPATQLNESHLRAVIKADFPELYDCLLLLNNPDQFSKVSDLLRQKRYTDWENEFIDDEITTSQRTTSVAVKKKLSEAIEQHIQILFGESAMFMSLTDLSASREGFSQVFNDYKNLRSFISFCELFLDKLMYDLNADLGKSLPLSVNHYNKGMNITFDSPLHTMVRNHSQARRKNGFMKKWTTRFHLCDDLFFETPIKGMGYFPGVKKNHESTPLSEEGAGSNHLMMMLLEIAGSPERYDLHDFNDEPRNYPRTIMIEEPETRLHPAWQSRLADMFVDARKETGCDFILDTCSEYLIRKLQYLVSAGELDKNDVVIYYLDANRCKSGDTTLREITIGDDGELSQPFGPGFLFEEEIEMIKLKKVNSN